MIICPIYCYITHYKHRLDIKISHIGTGYLALELSTHNLLQLGFLQTYNRGIRCTIMDARDVDNRSVPIYYVGRNMA